MPENNPKTRVKDEHADHDHIIGQLSPELQAFNAELATIFPDIRYTSGKRKASDKVGNFSKVSHHNTGNAVDIGKEHSDVYDYLMNSKEGLQLLNKYGLGIIDETDPETLKATGGTGPHFHIGKDSKYVNIAKERFTNYDKIQPLNSYFSSGKSPMVNTTTQTRGMNTQTTVPFQLESGQVVGMPINADLFEREIEKEVIKDQMVQESPARQRIEQEQSKRRSFLEGIQNQYLTEKTSNTESSAPPVMPEQTQIDIQNSLPSLPTIFTGLG